MENIEERSQQRLKILPIVLVGGQARLEFGARLRKQAFAVDLQEFGGLLRCVVFSPKFKGDLLRLRFLFAARTVQVRFGLRQFGTLFPAPIDGDWTPKLSM